MQTQADTPGYGRLLVTIQEAAVALGLGRSTVYELVAGGELESVTVGRARRIPVRELEEFVTRLEEKSRPVPPRPEELAPGELSKGVDGVDSR
jgi:excisionase family DNA binding protein